MPLGTHILHTMAYVSRSSTCSMGLEAARVCCGCGRGGGGGTAGSVAGAGSGGTRPENGDWEPPNADEDVVEPPNIL